MALVVAAVVELGRDCSAFAERELSGPKMHVTNGKHLFSEKGVG